MSEFVASNGYNIVTHRAGQIELDGVNISPGRIYALREFFLAERDAELGRWRSKERPECVVYDVRGQALVLDEAGCRQFMYGKHNLTGSTFAVGEAKYRDVAREFFAAQPEPKPWHKAERGEVWELTYGGQPTAHVYTHRTTEPGFAFLSDRAIVSADDPDITAGRRIWPEVSE